MCTEIVKFGIVLNEVLFQTLYRYHYLIVHPEGTPNHEVCLNGTYQLNYLGGVRCPISQVPGLGCPNSCLGLQLEISGQSWVLGVGCELQPGFQIPGLLFIRGVVGLSEDFINMRPLQHLPDHALGGHVSAVLRGSQGGFELAILHDTSQLFISAVSASVGFLVI